MGDGDIGVNGAVIFGGAVEIQQVTIAPGAVVTFTQDAPVVNTISTTTGSTLAEPILPGSTITGTETNLVVTPPAPLEVAGDAADVN